MTKTLFAPAAALGLLSACSTAAPSPPPTVPPPPPCPVVSSSDWRAWVNSMPGPMNSGATLHVVGKVVMPYSNWEARLTNVRVMESSPVQVVVEIESTTNSTEPRPATPVEIRGSWPSEPRVGSVTVTCAGKTLARIAPVETVH